MAKRIGHRSSPRHHQPQCTKALPPVIPGSANMARIGVMPTPPAISSTRRPVSAGVNAPAFGDDAGARLEAGQRSAVVAARLDGDPHQVRPGRKRTGSTGDKTAAWQQ